MTSEGARAGRAFRGGSRYTSAAFNHAAQRGVFEPDYRYGPLWVRCVLRQSTDSFRVDRGGRWNEGPALCRAARRSEARANFHLADIEFRCVRR